MTPPISLYIHVPFCQTKCPYCAFYKEVGATHLEEAYLTALTQELAHYETHYGKQFLKSIFLGGGTPSKLSSKSLNHLFSSIQTHMICLPDCEITMEANPESITPELLETFKACGGNRLSVGVQSFDPNELHFLGRTHTPNSLDKALKRIQSDPHWNLNIDLIFGLPISTLETLQKTISQALSYQPNHLSTYALTIEPNTVFDLKKIRPMESDQEQDHYEYIIKTLKTHGYEHYEISAFAKPQKQCQHNRQYWTFNDFIGLGPSGSSLFQGKRATNSANLDAYIQDPTPPMIKDPNRYILDPKTQETEFILSHFRLLSGVPIAEFETRFKHSVIESYRKEIKKLEALKLLTQTETHLVPTPKGISLLNEILMEFIP